MSSFRRSHSSDPGTALSWEAAVGSRDRPYDDLRKPPPEQRSESNVLRSEQRHQAHSSSHSPGDSSSLSSLQFEQPRPLWRG